HSEVPPDALTRVRSLAGDIAVVTSEDIQRDPAAANNAEVILTQAMPIDAITSNPNLRWIQTLGAGVEWLLKPEVQTRAELIVTNARGVHAQPIAEQVFGYILMFDRQMHVARPRQTQGRWDRPKMSQLLTLNGKTLGILGVGAIGERVAGIGKAFGMRVLGLRRGGGAVSGIDRIYKPEQLHELLRESDFIVNALPLTAATSRLIGAAEFEAMKKSAFLVNIGRGATIDTASMLRALQEKRIAGVGLDVTDPEPLPADHPLWQIEDAIITPHYAGGRADYGAQVSAIFVDNLERYLHGKPLINVVDKNAGY
ncbi:MAG TPA: D-2-hydroxyacid dehydrogenase, partial [Polyangiales bacterium]|nr:D-2-hydroxyacid dehydrogenase [Polyangiales bacterium]